MPRGEEAWRNLTEKPRLEELVLVRHGESEGNVAYQRSMRGDHSLYAGAFLERHSSLWRLTDAGQEQAQTAGKWIKENLDARFHAYYTSEYLRAMETASLLNLRAARWRPDVLLRERDWGDYDLASMRERSERFGANEERRQRESLFWAPPGGESLAHVVARVDILLLFLNRRFTNKRVLIVAHGELMWAFRMRFERLTQLRYRQMQREAATSERIHNAQTIVYSRRCPVSGDLSSDFRWTRSVCPWDPTLSPGDWREIERADVTNQDLWAEASAFPRLYNDSVADAPGEPPPSSEPLPSSRFEAELFDSMGRSYAERGGRARRQAPAESGACDGSAAPAQGALARPADASGDCIPTSGADEADGAGADMGMAGTDRRRLAQLEREVRRLSELVAELRAKGS